MSCRPIIPIWLMAIWCVAMLVFFRRKQKAALIRQIVAILMLFIINIRILIPSDNVEQEISANKVYVVMVVDGTISMAADDGEDGLTRLDNMKADCKAIVDAFPGAHYSIITFNNDARIILPFSSDMNYAKNNIDALSPIGEMWAQGTNLNVCYDVLERTLKHARDKEDGSIVVFYMSDGEANTDKKKGSFDGLKKYIDGGAVVGYGTSAGGKMRVKDYWSEAYSYIKDPDTGRNAITKIDEKSLKKIAGEMNIPYIHTSDQKDFLDELATIEKNCEKDTLDIEGRAYIETYYWFLIPLIGIMIYEVFELKYQRRKIKNL